jgi:hypothetical protein
MKYVILVASLGFYTSFLSQLTNATNIDKTINNLIVVYTNLTFEHNFIFKLRKYAQLSTDLLFCT